MSGEDAVQTGNDGHTDNEARARRAAAAMWEADRASKWLGLSLDAVGPGTAEMSMMVEAHHTNGHEICHGGFIFTLADSAFAFACNSYNQRTVAQQNAITFCAPGQLGDRLVARAVEVTRSGRSGVYDVTVTNQDGVIIAVMRGNARTVGGTHVEEDAPG
jgi:acyl-CoA thioesterase